MLITCQLVSGFLLTVSYDSRAETAQTYQRFSCNGESVFSDFALAGAPDDFRIQIAGRTGGAAMGLGSSTMLTWSQVWFLSQMGTTPEPDEDKTERRSFGLSSGGEEVYLLSATPSGERTDYVHGFTFGDSAAGFSFGRHVNSIGKISYPPLEATSFNASNDLPRTGPLVITEMMYHPANGSVEFIEIQNISSFSGSSGRGPNFWNRIRIWTNCT